MSVRKVILKTEVSKFTLESTKTAANAAKAFIFDCLSVFSSSYNEGVFVSIL